MPVVLERIKQNGFATYGRLEAFTTLELPWLDNARDVSCVPAGSYTAERYLSPAHGYVVFRLIDVPGRSDVEIHVANLPCDLLGCIGIGQGFGPVQKDTGESGDGIVASRAAFLAFMANHPEQRFTLLIQDVPS